ncbi:MAG: hypothetical protein DSY86_06470 [Marinomonas sp.]|nr:MAG: hypothetical protein DSY86_06470 [Marinomonas sp.]
MEYRGYDSVGIATKSKNQILLRKGVGKVVEVKAKNPVATIPRTLSTTGPVLFGRESLFTASHEAHKVKMVIQSNREPSWPPHTALILYQTGNRLFECWLTYKTEKSS